LTQPNILILDLECAPKVAYVWQFWKTHVNPDQVVADGYLMTAAWKWFGEEAVHCVSEQHDIGNDYEIVKVLTQLLDRADIVIAHNAKKFDIPLFNARCLIHGIAPPSPYKIVDTLETAKKKFRFDSNKLEYIATLLKCTPKGKHKKYPGFTLWAECMKGNQEAWAEMVEYNIGDVETLEEIYVKLRPWMDNHPNVANLVGGLDHRCPKCGGTHLTRRGSYTTNAGVYQRYRCTTCGGWSRSRYSESPLARRKALLTHAAVM